MRARTIVVVAAILLAVGVVVPALLGAFGPTASVPFPGEEYFRLPSEDYFHPAMTWTPPIPASLPLGVPIRGIDPGFNGWRGIVIGRVTPSCPSRGTTPPEVALLRGTRFVTGQVIGKQGGFTLSFQWPLVPRNGGNPESYTVLTSSGAAAQVTISVDDTTYVVLSGACPS